MTAYQLDESAPVPAEGLFGAVSAEVVGGLFAPVAVVAVDGVDIASGAAAPGDPDLMVVDGVRVTWGRGEVLAQPVPATGWLALFDATRTWATRADRRGLPVTVRYEGLAPDGSTVSGIFFRGRIGSPVTVSAKTVIHPVTGETIHGAVISVPLQSILVDLANIVPVGSFPAETMGARVDRLVAAAQSVGILTGGGNVRDYWRTPMVAPVDAADQVSILEHLARCFDSAGADSYAYRPHTDELRHVGRRHYGTTATFGRLWWEADPDVSPRADQGAFIRAVTFLAIPGGEQATGLYLDAATLEYDPAEGITTPARITRVVMSHPDSGAAYATRTVEVPVRRDPQDPLGGNAPLDERALGVRTARMESLVAWNAYADLSLDDTRSVAGREASRWLLAPLRLVTRKLGGFETVGVAQFLLAGYEHASNVFLQRSALPSFGVRPVVGVMGATIIYARQGWDIELIPAPVTTEHRQHILTAEDLNSPDPVFQIEAWDAPHPKGLHPSVTAEDLRYVGALLSGPQPAETERDEYQ